MRVRDKAKENEFFQNLYPAVIDEERQSRKSRIWQFVRANPKLIIQILLIIIVFAAERIRLDRKMSDAGQAIEKMRGVADILTGTLESVKKASEAPSKIEQVLNL
jgi:hypothetical protein